MEKISLVIPVKDEGPNIQGLIDSILSQTLLPGEIIFVDGGSGDNTKTVIKSNIRTTKIPIRLIETDKAYPGEGRNIGIKESSFNLIALTDAGIKLDKNWLSELARPIEEDGSVDVVYGAYEPVMDSFIKECALIAFVPPKDKINGSFFRTNFIASSLFRKKIFETAGWFPPYRAAEDRIFMEKVRELGIKTRYTDRAMVFWDIPGSIEGIFRRFSAFSFHDIIAGRAKDWHYSVFRTYAAMVCFFSPGVIFNHKFLWGVAAVWVLRVLNVLFKKRHDMKLKYLLDIKYFLGINFILVVTDMALFAGALKYLRTDYAGRK
jgi:glycosyltransferase involved in cell wall biosynthesis